MLSRNPGHMDGELINLSHSWLGTVDPCDRPLVSPSLSCGAADHEWALCHADLFVDVKALRSRTLT